MDDLTMGLSLGILVGALITLLVVISTGYLGIEYDIEELGQSICDQEYDMDYDSYYKEVLKCKPKVIKEEVAYDGITIQIKDGGE